VLRKSSFLKLPFSRVSTQTFNPELSALMVQYAELAMVASALLTEGFQMRQNAVV